MGKLRNPPRDPAAGSPSEDSPPAASIKPHIASVQSPNEAADPLAKLARLLLVSTVFLLFSRGAELMGMLLGSSFYIVRLLAIALLAAAFLTGGFYRAFQSIPLRLLTAYTIWLIACTPLSCWVGGSVALLSEHWFRAFSLAVVTAAFVLSTQDARRVLIAIGAGAMLLAVLAPLLEMGSSGRLQMESGTVGNPNDLAFFLLGGIPGCILLSKSTRRLWRFVGRIAVVLSVVVAMRTGSRMGVVIMAVFCVVEFFRASIAGKLRLMVAVFAIGVLGASLAPRSVWERYRTMWSDEPEISEPDEETDATTAREVSSELGKASGSSLGRKQLLKKSVEVTLQHPLFGVGPGMFGVYVGGRQTIGERGLAWRQTHNTYTEISSEAGIPALLAYLGLLVYTLRTSFRLGRQLRRAPALAPYADVADCLFQASVIYAVGCLFGSFAYSYSFPMLAAVTGSFERCVSQEVRSWPLASLRGTAINK